MKKCLFRVVLFHGDNVYPMTDLSKQEVMDCVSTALDDMYDGGIIIQLEENAKDEM